MLRAACFFQIICNPLLNLVAIRTPFVKFLSVQGGGLNMNYTVYIIFFSCERGKGIVFFFVNCNFCYHKAHYSKENVKSQLDIYTEKKPFQRFLIFTVKQKCLYGFIYLHKWLQIIKNNVILVC